MNKYYNRDLVTRSLTLESESLPSSFRAKINTKPISKSKSITNNNIISNNVVDNNMINNNLINKKTMNNNIINSNIHNNNPNNVNNINENLYENYIEIDFETASRDFSENRKDEVSAESLADEIKEKIKRKKSRLKAERSQIFSLRDDSDDLGSDSGISSSSSVSSSNKNKNVNDNKDDCNEDNMISDTSDKYNNINNNVNNDNKNNNEYHLPQDEYLKKTLPRSGSNIVGNKGGNKVEAATIGFSSGQGGRFINMSKELLKALKGARGRGNDRGAMQSPQIRNNKKENTIKNKFEGVDRDQDIVQSVDLSSVPLLVAPPIEDEKELVSVVTFTPPADVYSYPPSTPDLNGGRGGDRGSVDKDEMKGSEEGKKRYFEEISYNDINHNIDNNDDNDNDYVENINNKDGKRKYNIADVKSILKMEIEGSIEEVEYTGIKYGPLGTKRRKKSDSEEMKEKGMRGRGGGIGERDGGRGRGVDRVRSSLIEKGQIHGQGQGQGQGQSEGEVERVSQLNYYTSDGQITTLTDLQHVEARDSSDLGGLRFSPRSVSISAVMTAADEMANDLTALKNDLGDLDDSNVRHLFDT